MPKHYPETRERGRQVLVASARAGKGAVVSLIYDRPSGSFVISNMGPITTIARNGRDDDAFIAHVMQEFNDAVNAVMKTGNPNPAGGAERLHIDLSESNGLRIKMQTAMNIRKEGKNAEIRDVLRGY